MKNLLLFLIIILTASLGFYACDPKEEYHNVPTKYYPAYKEGDTLFYRCGIKYDTFILDSVSICDVMHDLGRYQFIDYFIISKNYPELNQPFACSINLDFGSITIDWLNCSQGYGYDDSHSLQSMVVNNVAYTNVYELDNYSQDTIHSHAKKLYFNSKYWVVRYIRNDSTTWDLIQH